MSLYSLLVRSDSLISASVSANRKNSEANLIAREPSFMGSEICLTKSDEQMNMFENNEITLTIL